MSLFDTVSQIGSVLGTAGGAGATVIWHRFESAITSGKKALTVAERASEIARKASESAEKAVARAVDAEQKLEAFVRAIRAELDAMRTFPSARESPIPGLHSVEELRKELIALREELRGDILRERGQRHALQSEIAATAREQVKSWMEMTTAVAELKGAWEFVRTHILSRPKM